MDRKAFLRVGCCGLVALTGTKLVAEATPSNADTPPCDDGQLKFVQNWVTDLMDTLDTEFDEPTKIKLMSGCGRGCFHRFQFKQDIAAKGKGNVDKLIDAYKANFEVWRDGDTVHIRYGEINKNGCYCPAAKYRPGKPHDIHCYCTRATHQTIWETALGKPVQIDILQTVRRGDPTCHFLVHLS